MVTRPRRSRALNHCTLQICHNPINICRGRRPRRPGRTFCIVHYKFVICLILICRARCPHRAVDGPCDITHYKICPGRALPCCALKKLLQTQIIGNATMIISPFTPPHPLQNTPHPRNPSRTPPFLPQTPPQASACETENCAKSRKCNKKSGLRRAVALNMRRERPNARSMCIKTATSRKNFWNNFHNTFEQIV